MFNNSSKMLFFFILVIGSLVTISSTSWMGAWMGLEINLLSFIPLMSDNKNNLMSSEASLKYFLTQALASTIFLFAVIILMLQTNLLNELKNEMCFTIILISLLIKSGTAPFHFWFPNIMKGMTWFNALILMTWQKIAPLILISYVYVTPIIMSCAILSSLIGALGGLNQTSLRELMAFSSIGHLGWMLTSMYISENLWIIYFLFYSFLSINLVYMFNIFKTFHINQLFSMFINSKILKFCLFMNLLSLGGLPPFLGFLPKWMVIQNLSTNNQYFLMTSLIVLTLITLYFYIRLCYSAFMLNYYENNWNNLISLSKIHTLIYLLTSFWSLLGLFLIYIFYFM